MIKINNYSEKVRSKSLDDDKTPDYYEKIVDKEPLPEDELYEEQTLNTPLNNFNMEIKNLLNEESKGWDYNNETSHEITIDEIKQAYDCVQSSTKNFKEILYGYICGSYFQRSDCDIVIKSRCVEIHADFFNREVINRVNRLGCKWIIQSTTAEEVHNLKLKMEWK